MNKQPSLIYPYGFEFLNANTQIEQERGIDSAIKKGHMPIFIFNNDSNNIKNLIPTKFKKNIEKHPAYLLWITTLMRCYNKGYEEYPQYGGAGVTVKNKWINSFTQFCKDMKITQEMA